MTLLVWSAMTVTDTGCDQVWWKVAFAALGQEAGRAVGHRYRPAGSWPEKTPVLLVRIVITWSWLLVNLTVPGIGCGPGCLPWGLIGPPSIMSQPVTVPGA